MAAIEVDGLVIRYGSLTAVDDVSFDVAGGEVVTLLGPNGAGKTSTVEALEGYRRPAAGTVRVLGFDPVTDRARLVHRIGVMPQQGGVHPGIRAIEMLRLYAGFYSEPTAPDVLLERVGLTGRARTMWREMSGGEQQRLSLALALIGHPDVVFLDEPTAGVDVTGRQLVRRIVRDLADAGIAVLLTTHDLAEAEKVADRAVIIDRGVVVAAGRPNEIAASVGTRHIRFTAAAGLDVAALAAALGAPTSEESPGDYRVDVQPDPALVATLTAWLADRDELVRDLRVGTHHLEEVFWALTTGREEPGGHPSPDLDVPLPEGNR